MNTAIDVPTVAELAHHPNIAGLKDTSAEDRMPELIAATRGKDFALLQGREPSVLSSLQAGASGCLTALAGVVPEWYRDLYNAHLRGDAAEAQAIFDRASQLFKMFRFPEISKSFAHFVHMLKFAAHARGWIDSTASLIPGFESDAAFDKLLMDHLKASEFPFRS
jgi:4-hydroxy-tetrahydrodipicolinate synthase